MIPTTADQWPEDATYTIAATIAADEALAPTLSRAVGCLWGATNQEQHAAGGEDVEVSNDLLLVADCCTEVRISRSVSMAWMSTTTPISGWTGSVTIKFICLVAA